MFLPAKELLQNVEYQASALSKIQDYDAYTTAAHHLNQVDAEVDRRVASVFHTSVRNIQTMIRDQKQKAFLRATRDIKTGEEIFIDYGFEYWDFFYKEHLKLK